MARKRLCGAASYCYSWRMSDSTQQDYLVLARKYRPQNFSELVGQDALVCTLTNAIETQKIHHAYVLTGIRGTGKTTTARIMAMALNCTNGPSPTWPEDDVAAQNIAQGRHVDVLEFDAASHRKAEEIAELFEGVAYAPVEGRYKIYIIDEVHMLSKHAFNAILKTLEEPPANVKFIFATTEVNKIPVTVLSRCQRFDLKRISAEDLCTHYMNILKKENITAEEAAVMHIARAADGSARDGLSLLDQAIALSEDKGITAELVAGMLGQAEAARVYDFLDALFSGDAPAVLNFCENLYAHGQDATIMLNDTLHALHLLTRLKIVADLKNSPTLTELERTRGVPLADKLPLENISRVYQMLSHATADVKNAARPFEALGMAAVRIAHLAALPPVQTLIHQAQSGTLPQAPAPSESSPVKKQDDPQQAAAAADTSAVPPWESEPQAAQAAPEPQATPEPVNAPAPNSWADIVALIKQENRSLGTTLSQDVKALTVAPPKLELLVESRLHDSADIIRELRTTLTSLTNQSWDIASAAPESTSEQNVETHSQTEARVKAETITDLKNNNPDIQAILNTFEGADVVDLQ